jgi:hypothetical protein
MHGGMTLTSEQLAAVRQWAAEGATLNDLQARLKQQFGVSLTYLEARLLMVDLQVSVQDKPREKPAAEEPAPAPAPAAEAPPSPPDDEPAPAGGSVTVTVDQLAIPGAMVSGRVTFSDGKTGAWYIDQMGRLGMRAPEQGYQPPPADIPVFQSELDRLLAQAGF